MRSKEPLARRIGEVVKRAITGEVDIFQHSSSNFGAIGSPYFPTAHSVIAAEENSSLRSRVIAAELSLQQEQRESGRRASRASAESRAQLEYLEEKLRKK